MIEEKKIDIVSLPSAPLDQLLVYNYDYITCVLVYVLVSPVSLYDYITHVCIQYGLL